jgi:hypothetical protein
MAVITGIRCAKHNACCRTSIIHMYVNNSRWTNDRRRDIVVYGNDP